MPNHTVLCWDNWQLDSVLFNGSNFKDSEIPRLFFCCWAAHLDLKQLNKNAFYVFFCRVQAYSPMASYLLSTKSCRSHKKHRQLCSLASCPEANANTKLPSPAEAANSRSVAAAAERVAAVALNSSDVQTWRPPFFGYNFSLLVELE